MKGKPSRSRRAGPNRARRHRAGRHRTRRQRATACGAALRSLFSACSPASSASPMSSSSSSIPMTADGFVPLGLFDGLHARRQGRGRRCGAIRCGVASAIPIPPSARAMSRSAARRASTRRSSAIPTASCSVRSGCPGRPACDFVQLTVPGANVREQLAMLRWFIAHHAEVRALVLALDERWCVTDPALPLRSPFPFWLYSDSDLVYLANALSTRTLRDGFRRLASAGGARRRSTVPAIPTTRRARRGASRPASRRRRKDFRRATSARFGASRIFPGLIRLDAMLAEVPAKTAVVIVLPPQFYTRLPPRGHGGGAVSRLLQVADRAARRARRRQRVPRFPGRFRDRAKSRELHGRRALPHECRGDRSRPKSLPRSTAVAPLPRAAMTDVKRCPKRVLAAFRPRVPRRVRRRNRVHVCGAAGDRSLRHRAVSHLHEAGRRRRRPAHLQCEPWPRSPVRCRGDRQFARPDARPRRSFPH